MTTNTLAKKYPLLSADERFSLLQAASARGDEVEVNRLAQSAARSSFKVSDLFGRSLAFVVVSMIHHMQLLNLTAFFFKTSAIADYATGDSRPPVGIVSPLWEFARGYESVSRGSDNDRSSVPLSYFHSTVFHSCLWKLHNSPGFHATNLVPRKQRG